MVSDGKLVWLRAGWPEFALRQGATLKDIGRTMHAAMEALAAAKSVPKDKFGLHEFISLIEPDEDH
jgi:hypothetical protein